MSGDYEEGSENSNRKSHTSKRKNEKFKMQTQPKTYDETHTPQRSDNGTKQEGLVANEAKIIGTA